MGSPLPLLVPTGQSPSTGLSHPFQSLLRDQGTPAECNVTAGRKDPWLQGSLFPGCIFLILHGKCHFGIPELWPPCAVGEEGAVGCIFPLGVGQASAQCLRVVLLELRGL